MAPSRPSSCSRRGTRADAGFARPGAPSLGVRDEMHTTIFASRACARQNEPAQRHKT